MRNMNDQDKLLKLSLMRDNLFITYENLLNAAIAVGAQGWEDVAKPLREAAADVNLAHEAIMKRIQEGA